MGKPLIFNIQKYSLHDGEGIRTTVFFKGCPLSCSWCHNPESQRFEAELLFHADRCTGCGACGQACPQRAVSMESLSPPGPALPGTLIFFLSGLRWSFFNESSVHFPERDG